MKAVIGRENFTRQKPIMTAAPIVKYNAPTNAPMLLKVRTCRSILRHDAQIEKSSADVANRLESMLTSAQITWKTAPISKLFVLTRTAKRDERERTWKLIASNVPKRPFAVSMLRSDASVFV